MTKVKIGKGTLFKKAQIYMGPYGGLYVKVNGKLYRLQQIPPQMGAKVKKVKKKKD